MMVKSEELIEVAKVIKPVGLRGEVKLSAYTRSPQELQKYSSFLIQTKGGAKEELKLIHFRATHRGAVIKLSGIDCIEAADQLRDAALFIREDQLPAPEKGEYYIRDLIGVHVFTENGDELGILEEILELAAHDIYQIKTSNGEILIPAIPDVIIDIDIHDRKMIVRLQEGSDQIG
jgi:16S rRNA processing protein RimM